MATILLFLYLPSPFNVKISSKSNIPKDKVLVRVFLLLGFRMWKVRIQKAIALEKVLIVFVSS